MDSIEFRGKGTCQDKWYYGCYVECGGYYIVEKLSSGGVGKYQVIPETVEIKVCGQWFSEKELSDIVKKGIDK